MMAGMIGQHMKLTGVRNHIGIASEGEWAEGDSSCGQNGRRLQNTLKKGDLIGGAAERIDHSAKRRGVTSSWVREREEVWIYKVLLSGGFFEPRTVHARGCFQFYGV